MNTWYFYSALISFVIGVGVQTLYPQSGEVMLLGMVLSLGLAIIWRRNHFVISAPYVLLASIIFCAFSLGLLRTDVFTWQFEDSPLASQLGEDVSFTGIVAKEPDVREKMVMLQVETDTDTVLVSTDRLSAVGYGDEVVVEGTLQKPDTFITELGREFDYPNYLRAKRIEYTVSFAELQVVSSGNGNPIVHLLLQGKHFFMQSLEKVLPEPQVGLSEGLLLGVKQALGEDIESDFRRTGIIHIVVLSGYNVMLVVTFILFIFSFFLKPKQRMIAGLTAIVCFALLVGLSATVVRASIMASLLLLTQGFGQNYNVIRGLFLAGAIMLLVNPYLLLFDIGFQLSFMATLGLLLIVPHFETVMLSRARKLGVTDFLFSTLAAQIAVLPLLAYHIGEVSLVSLVVNMLVLPVVPIAMLLTFVTGIIAIASTTVAGLIGFLAYLSLEYILLVARFFAQFSYAVIEIPEFSAWGVAGLYGVYAFILLMLFVRNREIKPSVPDSTIHTAKTPSRFSREKRDGVSRESLPKIFR